MDDFDGYTTHKFPASEYYKQDQRGAAARVYPATHPENANQVQSAPHPDPAGPEMVSVPREPTEEMIDAPRQIILYAETRGRTLQGLREHLDLSGVEFHSWFPAWAITAKGHLTKAAIADLIYRAMLAAGSAKF